ncbi:MAG TPA: PDZ domain-containing protein [Gemmataceae bacterium]|jgi:tricorn protease|nr:PDZ domain-containing protein [Gemmataceae bacterium]
MKYFLVALATVLPASLGTAAGEPPLLLQKPTVNRTHIVFTFAGDLWSVSRNGGAATRLTSGPGIETDPLFSPDGTQIAFIGEYDGNVDVYLMPAAGGVPRRLTYHPGPDRVVGWSPDGKRILMWSLRASYSWFPRLFTLPLDGGLPSELPLPMGSAGSFSPDGSRIAYVPLEPANRIWKRYRGGRATPIWIANLADSRIEKVPRDKSNDFNPMWVRDRVYFLSDRNGPVTLFAYDPETKQVAEVLHNAGLDIKSASAGPDVIVYEQFGAIHLFDPATKSSRPVPIRIAADLLDVRPRFVKAAKQIHNAAISPSGARAVFEARGEIVTVPAEKGEIRNLTSTPGVAERDPAWSPDGKWLAYFSDQSGEYQLHVRDQRGEGEVKKYELGNAPSFYYSPTWSPDSKKIAYMDKRLNLWVLDLDKRASKLIDTDTYYFIHSFDPVWSPDSKWLAYTKHLKNYLNAVYLHNLENGKSQQVTDGMSDARFPVFDKNGKYLYFTASTNTGPTPLADMSSLNRPVTRSVYIAVLSKEQASPLAPESDDEKTDPPAPKPDKDKEKDKKPEPAVTRIDLENIDQRVLALPIPEHNYVGLQTGKAGTLYLLEGLALSMLPDKAAEKITLHKFDLEKRKVDKLLDDLAAAVVSHDGEKLLYRKGENWFLTGAAQPKPDEGQLPLDKLEVRVDPRAEWKQMYHEVWRIERDFLYDPGFHGLDLKEAEKRYEPYVAGLASRADLNYLLAEMLGNLTLGHVYVSGGDLPEIKRVKGGLLGCDYAIEHGRYRIVRIYRGENWNPHLRAPLTEPGVNVKEGDYLLAVNGREVQASDSVYSFFEASADKALRIKVGPQADGKDARTVTVVPIGSEIDLRNLSWIDGNRRKVERLSAGRLAYIYLTDTYVGGYTNFNRYFFAQIGKEGAVIDERFNRGGLIADYVIDYLRRPLFNHWTTREGQEQSSPQGAIFGPKAMIINEWAGSGGDAMPYYFRKTGIGPLIGKRTWGGLVGIDEYPVLLDGGAVTAPDWAFFNTEGRWEVENHGVDPDIEVELDPYLVRQGGDPQLEKAVQVLLEELRKNPPPRPNRPAYPNYQNGQRARR